MYNSLGRDSLTESFRDFFILALQQIQKSTHPSLSASDDALQYVETLIVKLLGALISHNCSASLVAVVGSSLNTFHTTTDVDDRIARLIPDPLKAKSIEKAKEILVSLKNTKKHKVIFHGNDRSLLKTPVDKFHQLLEKKVLGYKIDVQVSQYLLAVLEFIATDIIQLSGHYVRNMTHTEITSQDIRVAMCADKVLMEIFYKDEEEVDAPPPSAGYYHRPSFFETDMLDYGEYGNFACESHRKNLSYAEAVNEFIQEERQFIRELSLIIKVFRDPLIAILPEEDLQKIFVNIDDIYAFSNKFVNLLEDAVEATDDEESGPAIGSCFLEVAEEEEMDVFHKYAQNVMMFSFRDHLCYVLSQHTYYNQINEIFSRYGVGMFSAFRYVLPKLLILPVHHCFSYFKAIEKLKELTSSSADRELYGQAESTLQSVRNDLEKLKKVTKFSDGYFLRLYGRTNRNAATTKIKEIQNSFENWTGKDIASLCNEFIREGVLSKMSNPGKSIGHLSTRLTERRAFLFDGLLVLCKASNKRLVPGRGDSSSLIEWRCKERFFIRNIEIIDHEETCDRSNFYLPSFLPTFGSSHNSGGENSPGPNSVDQSFTSTLSSSVSNINSYSSMNYNDNNSSLHEFEVSQRNQSQSSIVLVAKSAEEKDQWMSQLILLNMRSMLERTLDSRLSDEAKKHPLQLPHPSVYRFAIEDMDSNIIFEHSKSLNDRFIKAATLLKLIERLTYHKTGDPNLVRTFLTTYRSFCTPQKLLRLLIERFEIPEPDFRSCMQAMHYANNDELASPVSVHPPPSNSDQPAGSEAGDQQQQNGVDSVGPTSPTSPTLSGNMPYTPLDSNHFFDEQDEQCQYDYREMLKRFRKEYAQPVQFRVLNLLRHWIDNHFYDFRRDSQMIQILDEFLSENLAKSQNKVHNRWYDNLRKVFDRRLSENEKELVPYLSSTPPPIEWWIASQSNEFEEYDFLTLHPVEIARQLTLLEFDLYRAVKPYELIGMEGQTMVWTKKDKQKTSPNLLKMIRQNSIITFYLEKCIVEADNFEERVALVSRIVEILGVLLELNNFNGAFEIVAVFNSAAIHRLEHTVAQIEKNSKYKKIIDEAKELMADHCKKYKEKLRAINPPCVPFFGNFLTTLVYLEDALEEYILPANVENLSLHESKMVIDNGDSNESGKLINFQKKRRIAETIDTIQQYQNQPYCLNVESTIRGFLENLHTDAFFDMEEKLIGDYLYEKSLEIEPRYCKQPPKFARRWPERNLKPPAKSRNLKIVNIANIAINTIHNQSSNNNHNVNHYGNNHNHSNHNSNQDGFDSVSLSQAQQSPSTPLTPSNFNNNDSSTFPSVSIGGTPPTSTPTSLPLVNGMRFSFQPLSSSMNSGTFFSSTLPPPQTPHHHSPQSNDILSGAPPPLPPRTTQHHHHHHNHYQSNHHHSGAPPPLPPRTYCKNKPTSSSSLNTVGGGVTVPNIPVKTSWRDKGPPPLPPIRSDLLNGNHHHHHHHPNTPSLFVHQRFNSDIVMSSSPDANHQNQINHLRRNSTLVELPPRRHSQGGSSFPSSISPSSPSTPSSFSPSFAMIPSPSTPPSSATSTRPPAPIPPSPSSTSSVVGVESVAPERPPKTYLSNRLSNACR